MNVLIGRSAWGNKKYMNMKHLEVACQDASSGGWPHSARACKLNLRITLDSTEKGSELLWRIVQNGQPIMLDTGQ